MKEYKVVKFDRYRVVCENRTDELEDLLNGLGKEGWMLVSILGYEEDVRALAVLERQRK